VQCEVDGDDDDIEVIEQTMAATDVNPWLIMKYHAAAESIIPGDVSCMREITLAAGNLGFSLTQPPPKYIVDKAATVHLNNRGGQGTLFYSSSDRAEMRGLTCCTEKDKTRKDVLNATTCGVLAVTWSCGIILNICELHGSESLSQVYAALIALWLAIDYVPPYFFYDDACHLSKFSMNRDRRHPGKASKFQTWFAQTTFFVDRLHFKNHKDPWCKQHMDPALHYSELDGVNSQACEQLFAWMSKFKAVVRHMNEIRFKVFLLHMCHLHNCDLESRMESAGKLMQAGSTADVTLPPVIEEKHHHPHGVSALYMAATAGETYTLHMLESGEEEVVVTYECLYCHMPVLPKEHDKCVVCACHACCSIFSAHENKFCNLSLHRGRTAVGDGHKYKMLEKSGQLSRETYYAANGQLI